MKEPKNNIKYSTPKIESLFIVLEESIMAGSVTIDTGGTDQDLFVNDWEDANDDRYKDVDL
ncbi:hypothetical protein [Sphingobacterium lactis]|uniref:Uncharacterized protein n=1 Tax=Sphingobacterium lactis TaxID=797291 RepID=A0A1H6BDM9_9SPHI|nr:hypothetical protein [Sphingobacterium lactis]SEG58879.1 hypothetical protein SAMN05421877_11048 [Sphingobacterium lactis]